MKSYFGKDLRWPIYYALKIVAEYLDKTLDVTEISLTDYEPKRFDGKLRNNTVYVITGGYPDESQYFKNDIYSGIAKGYLGSTLLPVAMHDSKILFKSREEVD